MPSVPATLDKMVIQKIRAGAKGVVVKAVGSISNNIYVVHNGEIIYLGVDDRRANKVFYVIANGINYREDLAG